MTEKSEKQLKKAWAKPQGRVRWWMWVLPLLVISLVVAWPKAKVAARKWSAGRHLRNADQLIQQKDFKRAMIDVRSAIDSEGLSARAVRVMAEALEGAGAYANAATWRSQLDTMQPGDSGNTVAWAADSLKAGDIATSARLLSRLSPQPEDDWAFHATAGAVAEALRDRQAAEKHWAAAVRLKPNEDSYKMRLAALHLTSKDSERHAQAVSVLRELSGKNETALPALRALLTDAVYFEDWQHARTYADTLVGSPASTFADKLTRLDLLRKVKADSETAYLAELRNIALGSPTDLYLMLMWMDQQHLALVASEWVRSLPADQLQAPMVSVAVATVLVRSAEWQRLREFLEGHDWGDWECLRHAFLSRTLEKLADEEDAAAQEWTDAITVARSQPDAILRLERIVRLAIGWGWEQRAQDVMWSMINAPLCPPWIPDALRQIAEEGANAAQLQKLAALRLRADPKSAELRNAFAFYSLLARTDSGDPHREAERLFAEHPGNTAIAITRALSLYQQGRTDEALAVTSALPSAELEKPQPAFYQALFLTAKGEAGKAADFLATAGSRKMFAEEKSLIERARMNAEKASREHEYAAAAKAAREAKAARDAEAEKAIEAARAARSQAAQATQTEDSSLTDLINARRMARARADAEKETAVQEARILRERNKSAKESDAPRTGVAK